MKTVRSAFAVKTATIFANDTHKQSLPILKRVILRLAELSLRERKRADTKARSEATKGCGSTIGIASLAVLAVAGGVTFVATKKKED